MSNITIGEIKPFDLKTDSRINPLGIDNKEPMFSWKLAASKRDQKQSAYRIIVASSLGDIWDSGMVHSDETLQIKYRGSKLSSGQRCYWQVMVWDGNLAASEWSTEASFEMGLLRAEDWKGDWIGGNSSNNPLSKSNWIWHQNQKVIPASHRLYFRKVLLVPEDKKIQQAIFYGTCGNPFTVFVNGSTVAKMNQPWRQDWSSPFYHIDFTEHLKSGENYLTCEAEDQGSEFDGFIGSFVIEFADGSCEIISTDSTWVISEDASADASNWTVAEQIAEYGDQPWGAIKRRGPAPLLRKEFQTGKAVEQSRLYICCLGYYELSLNGQRVGDAILQQDYTQFIKRVHYSTFDITELLAQGGNCLGVELGRGYYAYGKDWVGPNPNFSNPNDALTEPQFLLQLITEYSDGTISTIASDSSWATIDGPTRDDNIWYGDKYDARLEQSGWNQFGFQEKGWVEVAERSGIAGLKQATRVPPIRILETSSCVNIAEPKPNVYIYDVGKVTAGWVRLIVEAVRGTRVKLTYGERLRTDGTLDIWKDGNNFQFWETAQVDSYICKGSGTEDWESKFSYKGFRYVQVEGLSKPCQLEALIFHNDVETIGSFYCSNSLFNRTHQIMVDTMLNNFHSVPTDTPAHEKRGWTADGQVIAECAVMNFDLSTFFPKWVQDMEDTQSELGEISHTCPGPLDYPPTPAWMSAYIIVPWTLYEYYGDSETLSKHYIGMKKYLQYELDRLVDGVSSDMHYADWCAPGGKGIEGAALLSTLYVYHSCVLMSRIAGIVGVEVDSSYYSDEAAKLANTMNNKFFDNEKQIYHTDIEVGYRQASNVLPYAFGIVPEMSKMRVIDNLADDILLRNKGHLNTGCFGTKYLAPVLTEGGRGDVAFTLAIKETYPSWGYWLANGATTCWEGWELEVRSYDHFFLGTLDDWFYKHLAGIQPESAGFKTSIIKPYVLGDLIYAEGRINTVRGWIESKWEREENVIRLEITVPVNTTATVYVPKLGSRALEESGNSIEHADGVSFLGEIAGFWIVHVQSGAYYFKA
ncbi:alpha-L-rhamnosidase [Paenibacillus psychroresistens]|nr:alpha-L-rhamnosidase [Paenibacillus psychroresistens]